MSGIEWGDYEIYDPGTYGPLGDLPRSEAKGAYERLMAAKPHRVEQLRSLLARNGVRLGEDDASIQAVNDWFRAHVERDPASTYRLVPDWYSVVNDLALFLGDVLIARHPGLHWAFFTRGRKDLAHQRHVIMGFDVANPRYNVDVDDALAGYAHAVVMGLPVPDDEFVQWLRG